MTANLDVAFREYRIPDGSPTGKRTWRMNHGESFVQFYAVGRKGRYWVGWEKPHGSGGEQVESFYAAQKRALAIYAELVK